MSVVFLNGSFVDARDARLSAFDAGVQHGVGLFETMLGVRGLPAGPGIDATPDGGAVVHLDRHLGRLAASARALGLLEAIRTGPLAEAVKRTCDRAWADGAPARLRVRLTVTGGDLNLLDRSRDPRPSSHEPTVLIAATPAAEYPPAMYERGIAAVVADARANPFDPAQGHKTLAYWQRLRELQAAAAKQAGEALVFQVTNHLAGGCVSNAFVVRDGELLTPIARGEETGAAGGTEFSPGGVLPSPVLPGVVRRWVLDYAEEEGLPARARMLSINDVLDADEVFLTNSSWGVLAVTRVEAKAIGGGGVGPLAARLAGAWQALTVPRDRR